MMELAFMTKYVNWDDVPLILGTKEVADVLGVHINTVKHLIATGTLPSFKIGRIRKVDKVDLKLYLEMSKNKD